MKRKKPLITIFSVFSMLVLSMVFLLAYRLYACGGNGQSPCSKPGTPSLVSPAHEATCQSTAGVTLDWSDVSCHRYYVYLSYTDSSPDDDDCIGNTTSSQYGTGTLEAGKTYYWRVRAKNYIGCSPDAWGDYSATREFTTEPAKASAPDPIDLAARVSLNRDLGWSAVDGAVNYDVYFGTSFSGVLNATKTSSQYKTNTTSTSYDPTPTGELDYKPYWWRVDANDTHDCRRTGEVWQFTTAGDDCSCFLDPAVADYSSQTSYSKGAVVEYDVLPGSPYGVFGSKVDNNQGNSLTNTAYWKRLSWSASNGNSMWDDFSGYGGYGKTPEFVKVDFDNLEIDEEACPVWSSGFPDPPIEDGEEMYLEQGSPCSWRANVRLSGGTDCEDSECWIVFWWADSGSARIYLGWDGCCHGSPVDYYDRTEDDCDREFDGNGIGPFCLEEDTGNEATISWGTGIDATDYEGQDTCTCWLIAHWKFDESTGTVAEDSESTHDGTLKDIAGTEWTTGYSGNALHFDDVNDYVDVPDSAGLKDMGELTVSAWIKLDDPNNGGGIVSKFDEDTYYTYALWYEGGNLLFQVGNHSESFSSTVSTNAVSEPGQWYHVKGIYLKHYVYGLLWIYVDGEQKDRIECASDMELGESEEPVIIGRKGDDTFDGLIDEVKIYEACVHRGE